MATDLYLRDDLAALVGNGDAFAFFAGLDGEVFRALESRRTFAVTLGGRRYFVKVHRGTGVGEILKNLLQLRLPVTSARNEWQALNRLKDLGIQVPVVAAYGKRGVLPQTSESFIVTEDVGTQLNLEDLTLDWLKKPPSFRDKYALIREVASISRLMHGNGICHRDFYICHFMVQGDNGKQLTLIDLHRALVKNNLGMRWIIKDVGSLYFSAMAIGLTRRDLLRYIRAYSGSTLRMELGKNDSFWKQVKARADRLNETHN
jgi:heptose I phosphotransferase